MQVVSTITAMATISFYLDKERERTERERERTDKLIDKIINQ